jgi:VanZ family protein
MSWRRYAFWLPSIAWAWMIFWASSQSLGPQPSWWFEGADKVIHAVLFGALAALIFLPLAAVHGWHVEWAALAAFVLATGYGLTDEIHQQSTAGRVSDLYDAAADATGAALAVALCILIARVLEKKRNRGLR